MANIVNTGNETSWKLAGTATDTSPISFPESWSELKVFVICETNCFAFSLINAAELPNTYKELAGDKNTFASIELNKAAHTVSSSEVNILGTIYRSGFNVFVYYK